MPLATDAFGAVTTAIIGEVDDPVPPLDTGKIPVTSLSKSVPELFPAKRA